MYQLPDLCPLPYLYVSACLSFRLSAKHIAFITKSCPVKAIIICKKNTETKNVSNNTYFFELIIYFTRIVILIHLHIVCQN